MPLSADWFACKHRPSEEAFEAIIAVLNSFGPLLKPVRLYLLVVKDSANTKTAVVKSIVSCRAPDAKWSRSGIGVKRLENTVTLTSMRTGGMRTFGPG